MMLPKKTVLKVTPSVPVTSIKKKSESLREAYTTILNRELLHLNAKKVNDILVNDLKIHVKDLPYRLKCVLAECLCYYMRVWPGWTKYDEHSDARKEYLDKFREYLAFKMNYIIKNEKMFHDDPPEEVKAKENVVSTEVQTDILNKNYKPEAPYNLVISGQPNVLNNIVFIEMDNNIVIKQHAEKPWKPLTIPEFLNYSFVYAEVKLPDIYLARCNLHEYQRYITESGDTATCPEVDYITYVRKLSHDAVNKVYSYNYIYAYMNQFLNIIRQHPGVHSARFAELEAIFLEFLKDIKATNPQGKTMATATSVCYNIGGNKYIRNKKMVINCQTRKDTNAINFCEILIPRTLYTLHEFTAEEDCSSEETTFKSLNEIAATIEKGSSSEAYTLIQNTINNCITYQCILCPKVYTGDHSYVEMLDHFRFLHKGEQSVLCFKCRRQFEIPKLSGDRWGHECDPKADNKNNNSSTPTTLVDASSSDSTRVNKAVESATDTNVALLSSTSTSSSEATQTGQNIDKDPSEQLDMPILIN